MKLTREERNQVIAMWSAMRPFDLAVVNIATVKAIVDDCNELEDQRNAINALLDAEMATTAALRESLNAAQSELLKHGIAAWEKVAASAEKIKIQLVPSYPRCDCGDVAKYVATPGVYLCDACCEKDESADGLCFEMANVREYFMHTIDEHARLRIESSNHAHDAEVVRRERDAVIAERDRLLKQNQELKTDAYNVAHAILGADLNAAIARAEAAEQNALKACEAQIAEVTARVEHAERERDHWKANHDNQVAIKAAILDRPDLKERSKLVAAHIARAERLAGLLRESNQALRSAYQIASRGGVNVNWISFGKMLIEVLEKQHVALTEVTP